MNVIYRYSVDKISEKAIEELDYSIICYPRNDKYLIYVEWIS